MKKIKKLLSHRRKKIRSMQMTISVSFTLLSVCCMCFLGVMLYQQFSKKAENLIVENSRQLINQTAINLEDYLRTGIRKPYITEDSHWKTFTLQFLFL